ncbi:MAG: hypothetical protein IT207_11445 [Fimbriimonadaceae bacterium]|nr:hypothetical protein [Fimbriimonadaceae bacterium]
MTVNMFVLCQSAGQLTTGSPVIFGIFRETRLERFPSPLPPFTVVLELEAEPWDIGHETILQFVLIDADGSIITDDEVSVHFAARPDGLPNYAFVCQTLFLDAPIPAPGLYRFDVIQSGNVIGSARLAVHDE